MRWVSNWQKSFELFTHVNSEIKKGDIVKLIDGSGLSLKENELYSNNKNHYIVFEYPELGFELPLKEYHFIVVETNITNRVGGGSYDYKYLQDIIVECNGIQFRTASDFVSKQ